MGWKIRSEVDGMVRVWLTRSLVHALGIYVWWLVRGLAPSIARVQL